MRKIIERLKYLKISDLKHLCLFFIALPCSLVFKFFHKEIWLICEDGNSARDNGYWFFKYLRENHKNIDAFFAITNDSADRNKIAYLGNIINFASLIHWIYYLSAKYIIISAKLGKPSPAICFPLEQLNLIKGKIIFLQHGITKDDMKSLYYDVCKFSLFVTSTKREFDFVENNFGYKNRNIVKLLGLARFDNLINKSENKKNNQILIMPTWRDWLGNASLHIKSKDFEKSEYFLHYQSLLNNKRFIDFIEKNNLEVVFFLHKGMQNFKNSFSTVSKKISIADWNKWDIQELLMESTLCVTDYSSIAFDFAYMKKPLLYYQFDYERFRMGHYSEGYFSYKDDGFGEICNNENELVNYIEEYSMNNFTMKDLYLMRVESFFAFNDNNNCFRTYEAIKRL